MKKQEDTKPVPTSLKFSGPVKDRLQKFNDTSHLGYPAIVDFAVAELFRALDEGAKLGYPDGGPLALIRPENRASPNADASGLDPKLIDERLKSIESTLIAISKKSWGSRVNKNVKSGEEKDAKEV